MKCTSSMIPNEFVGCILGNVQNVKGRLGPGTGNVNKTFPSTAFPSISFLNSAVVLTSSFDICQSFTSKGEIMDLLLDEGDEIEGGDVWGVVMGRFRQAWLR